MIKTKKAPEEAAMISKIGRKKTKFSATKQKSYFETENLRRSEMDVMREWFQKNPHKSICRRDVEKIIGKPCNHATRIVSDLLNERTIVVSHSAPSEHTGKTVQYVRYSCIGYKAKEKRLKLQKQMLVVQGKLF